MNPATAVDICREGLRLRIPERGSFPASVEIQIELPPELQRTKQTGSSPVLILCHGAPVQPEIFRTIRVRAELCHVQRRAEDSIVGLRFQAVATSVQYRLDELLHFLGASAPTPRAVQNSFTTVLPNQCQIEALAARIAGVREPRPVSRWDSVHEDLTPVGCATSSAVRSSEWRWESDRRL